MCPEHGTVVSVIDNEDFTILDFMGRNNAEVSDFLIMRYFLLVVYLLDWLAIDNFLGKLKYLKVVLWFRHIINHFPKEKLCRKRQGSINTCCEIPLVLKHSFLYPPHLILPYGNIRYA